MFAEIGVFVEDGLSVVVGRELRKEIQEMGKLAEEDRLRRVRTERLSKTPMNDMVCPVSCKPSETILSKNAKDKQEEKYNFAILQDQRLPFFGSMGPNIVQIQPDIINLFSLDDREYSTYLTLFYRFRDSNSTKILEAYVKTIDNMPMIDGQYINVMRGGQPIGVENTQAVSNFKEALHNAIRSGQSLETYGMSLSSYCQTWMKEGIAQDAAEFSVMSPHFQTRLNIDSIETFISHFGEFITEDQVRLLLSAQITSMTGKLEIANVKFADYTGAFVDVDQTWCNGL